MASFLIHTDGDALAAARRFLHRVWERMRLTGLLIPAAIEPGGEPRPTLITDPGDLIYSQPFAPVMAVNSARLLDPLARTHPGAHLAAVLQPCELRAADRACSLTDWLIIGTDCQGSYPEDEFGWRSAKAGSHDALTRATLRNSRQGGISDESLRPACQVCGAPIPARADLSIHTLGLPIKDALVIETHRPGLALSLGLEEPAGYEWQRMQDFILRRIYSRRRQVLDRELSGLPGSLRFQPAALILRLQACDPCQLCLDVCPEYDGSWQPGSSGTDYSAVEAWLASCTGCGMCEQACPNDLPLTLIHADMRGRARGAPVRC